MNDASVRAAGAMPNRVWAELVSNGYAVTSDEVLGLLSEKFRENFAWKYFNDKTLHRYEDDRPSDRKRTSAE
jgi:hypothetical protein